VRRRTDVLDVMAHAHLTRRWKRPTPARPIDPFNEKALLDKDHPLPAGNYAWPAGSSSIADLDVDRAGIGNVR